MNLQSNLVFIAASALRALRSISFLRSLQVIVSALLKTISEVANLLILLILLMYVWAIMGYNFFGSDPNASQQWGDLLNAMYALFQLVTVRMLYVCFLVCFFDSLGFPCSAGG